MQGIPLRNDAVNVARCADEALIYSFYRSVGRELSSDKIRGWLDRGYHCWLARIGGRTVGGCWVWFGACNLPALSGRCFSLRRQVVFDEDTGYLCYKIVDPDNRGKGIGTSILQTVLMHYACRGLSQLVATMGVSNKANIRSWMNCGARLIGIVRVRSLLGHVWRRAYFLDEKSVCWH